MDQLLPIYGCPSEQKATPAFERLVIEGVAYVLRGANTEAAAYVPESDIDLLHAYQRTDGWPRDRAANAIAAEIERRGLRLDSQAATMHLP